ncbi:hypothetical protein LSH36_987g00088 [Paralvinella palmiformis]|uniref:Uncharacterized protein n=1 Tax=Paralvinella palmiformis TaxID=53620 RepID=A0AAD9MSG4_9ANNE|nr:hypothetical protein LSH36_987g00088 [Paralvinella palmiformis]
MADEGKSDIIDVSEAGKLRSELLKDETVPGIHQFVAEQYEKQREELGDVNIEEERINNFFTRAVNESRRMSREVEKSHQQQQKLYAELGKEMFVEWRDEHAAQVLPGHQVQTVSRSMENMDME